MQFRWEVYNLFNTVNWSGINLNAQFNPAGEQVNASFGKATSARDPRIMQGAIRVHVLTATDVNSQRPTPNSQREPVREPCSFWELEVWELGVENMRRMTTDSLDSYAPFSSSAAR